MILEFTDRTAKIQTAAGGPGAPSGRRSSVVGVVVRCKGSLSPSAELQAKDLLLLLANLHVSSIVNYGTQYRRIATDFI
jgi:hypothetical protein